MPAPPPGEAEPAAYARGMDGEREERKDEVAKNGKKKKNRDATVLDWWD